MREAKKTGGFEVDTLTLDTIRAAQGNDLEAVTEVVKATESRIRRIAVKLSASADQREEFEQVGRVAVWEAIGRFSGNSVDEFFAFMTRTVDTTIRDAVRTEKNQGATGADHVALWTFAACVAAMNGDMDAAEVLSKTNPPKGRRLSADRARAARMAYEGPVSLDMPNGENGSTFADLIETDYGIPEDLITAADRSRAERDLKIRTVRAVIDSMGVKQGYVLKATYGIDPVPCLGTGAEADAELAVTLSMQPKAVKTVRRQAHLSFENRYRKVTGMA